MGVHRKCFWGQDEQGGAGIDWACVRARTWSRVDARIQKAEGHDDLMVRGEPRSLGSVHQALREA